MRGRPITAEEFDRMIAKVKAVREADADRWERYLTGLWLSGLRLEESLRLTWDADGVFTVDLSGKFPRFRIYAEAEKGHQDRLLPMTPDFAQWLLATPQDQRSGFVFPLGPGGRQLSLKRVSRTVSEIGETAGVVVNKEQGKFASAHDLRRSFGTRWASKIKPATLQLLMRHSTIDTTLRYYVAQDADDVARELWAGFGNTSGNTPTKANGGDKNAIAATADAINS
jgi:integrase